MNVKRLLALLLALGMLMSLAACGGGNTQPAADDTADRSTPTEPADEGPVDEGPAEIDNRPAAEVYTQDAVDLAAHEALSDEIYDEVLGEFYEYYQAALAELDPDTRMGLMAIAEAKLLESGVMAPYLNNAGVYAMSHIIPRSASTVSWGYDGDYRGYSQFLIADQFLTPEQRAELVSTWSEMKGSGEWYDYAKQWAADNGLTLADSYTLGFTSGYEPTTWDLLSSSRTAVGDPLSLTWDGLLR